VGSVFKKITAFFTNCRYGIPHGIFGAAAELSNLRIAQSVQRIQKKSLLLNLCAAFYRRHDFLQGFLAAEPLLRRFGVASALPRDYVFIKFPSVPMAALFVSKVLSLVLSVVKVFADFDRNFDGHSLSADFYKNLHDVLSFLKDLKFQKGQGGERQRGKMGAKKLTRTESK
jgi:hypothetical protein